jgi:hypothetical protein
MVVCIRQLVSMAITTDGQVAPTDSGLRATGSAAPESRYADGMLATMVWTLLLSAEPATAVAAKLAPATAKEMTAAVVAVNKALGLESWETKGVVPCVDRGGLEATIKDVSAEDTRRCAATAIDEGFPGLGKDYAIGIPMAAIGPVTVFALGLGDARGWGAYSCDPHRHCNPTKLSAGSKQAKRLSERHAKACANPNTVWFPSRDEACQGAASSGSAASAPAKP